MTNSVKNVKREGLPWTQEEIKQNGLNVIKQKSVFQIIFSFETVHWQSLPTTVLLHVSHKSPWNILGPAATIAWSEMKPGYVVWFIEKK